MKEAGVTVGRRTTQENMDRNGDARKSRVRKSSELRVLTGTLKDAN